MELKDKLKKLRTERGLTQAQLAEAIFVSRSAVAKWENGLGLPGPDSLEALQSFYGVPLEELTTTEPEAVIVRKNQKLHRFFNALWISGLVALMLYCISLPGLLQSGKYGFTVEMAAKNFADNPYIDTGDYRIYYSVFEGNLENGQYWSSLASFRPVEKHLWGCTVSSEDYEHRIVVQGHIVVGKLYSIKGRHGYYNLFKIGAVSGAYPGIPTELISLEEINLGTMLYSQPCPVEKGFFFITSSPIEWFWVGDTFYKVE